MYVIGHAAPIQVTHRNLRPSELKFRLAVSDYSGKDEDTLWLTVLVWSSNRPSERGQPQPNSAKTPPAATLRMRVADRSENPLSICPRRAGPAASVALVPSPTRFQSGYLGSGISGQSPIGGPPEYLLDHAAGHPPPLFSSGSLHILPLWRFGDIRQTGFAPAHQGFL
jgi:hypothetical protein